MADPRLVCVDVDYRPAGAVAAGVWFRGWAAADPDYEATLGFATVAEYTPGEFFRRELPCLLGVLRLGPTADVVLIDGYVWLAANRPGLGAHLHAALAGPAVVGVAKTRFAGATAEPVVRNAARPLFVTSAGMDTTAAADGVRAMHGPYRVPTLLRRVDRLARTAAD